MKYGTPLFALQELGGWESAEMVRRYAHLAADHLAPYAERLCAARVMESEPRHVLAVPKTARGCRRQALVLLIAGQDLNLRPSGYEARSGLVTSLQIKHLQRLPSIKSVRLRHNLVTVILDWSQPVLKVHSVCKQLRLPSTRCSCT